MVSRTCITTRGCVELKTSRIVRSHGFRVYEIFSFVSPGSVIHIVAERLRMRTVGWFNSQVAGLTLTWERKESTDLEDWFVNLPDDFLFWDFHLKSSRDWPLIPRYFKKTRSTLPRSTIFNLFSSAIPFRR